MNVFCKFQNFFCKLFNKCKIIFFYFFITPVIVENELMNLKIYEKHLLVCIFLLNKCNEIKSNKKIK